MVIGGAVPFEKQISGLSKNIKGEDNSVILISILVLAGLAYLYPEVRMGVAILITIIALAFIFKIIKNFPNNQNRKEGSQ